MRGGVGVQDKIKKQGQTIISCTIPIQKAALHRYHFRHDMRKMTYSPSRFMFRQIFDPKKKKKKKNGRLPNMRAPFE